jgi:origin recognition complex subunit 4
VLLELLHDELFIANTIIISLNGFVHTDDRLALKSITSQMNLEKEAQGKTFSSFSENLTFLLSCLKTGKDLQRLIIIIEEFDLFCAHHNQTLLYNLFDVAQSAQTPICVLGITCRLDVVELLEKRVKSRFSHRQIYLLPESDNFDARVNLFKELLKLPSAQEVTTFAKDNLKLSKIVFKEYKLPFLRRLFDPSAFEFSKKFTTEWNKSIDQLAKKAKVLSSLENLFDVDVSIASFKLFLFQIVSNLSDDHQFIKDTDIVNLAEHLLFDDDKVKLMTGLSVLEICILIAIKHHCEIYDNDPFNFEMILTRYNKFAYKSSSMQNLNREVVLKGFENLKVTF